MTGPSRFDHSARARLRVRGADRRDFLDRMATNALGSLAAGDGAPTFFLERTGRIVDRALVLERGEETWLLGSAGRGEALREWLARHVIADDVAIDDVTGDTVQFTVCGPGAAAVLDGGLGVAAAGLAPWGHAAASLDGAFVARDADAFGPSFEVVAPFAARSPVEAALASAAPSTAEAWDALRIAAGIPVFGREFSDRTIPLELRRTDHISFTKGCYVGQEVVARLHHHHRVKRTLVRLRIDGAAPPPPDAPLLREEEEVGRVTSAVAIAGGVIGLGLVDSAALDAALSVRDGASRLSVHVQALEAAEGAER